VFPAHDTGADGWRGTSPVTAFAPSTRGLHDMAGNVWEWTAEPFRVRSLRRAAQAKAADAARAGAMVIKGGSHLCHRSYCYRYRIAARSANPKDTSTGHLGARLVVDGG
jgi:formylglycine-generating enzyme required for sulfatase activity